MNDLEGEKYLEELEKSLREGKRAGAGVGSKSAPKQGRKPSADSPDRGRIDSAGERREGDILHLDDGSVGVFKSNVEGKEYQLVYFLDPDGKIKPQGVVLEAYTVKRLGGLPSEAVQSFKRSQRWNRDAVVFHLDEWGSVGLIPPAVDFEARHAPAVGPVDPRRGATGGAPAEGAPGAAPSGEQPAPAAPQKPGHEYGLNIGKRFKIKFGPSDWQAVYWGRDELGDIVVHNTNLNWAMMHLDLARFRDSLEVLNQLSMQEINEIREQLASQES